MTTGYVRQRCSARSSKNWKDIAQKYRQLIETRSDQTEPEFAKYRDDPVQFSIDCFGIEPWDCPADSPRSSQKRLLEDIVVSKRVACRSGQKVGKTTTAAIAAWWWLLAVEGTCVLTASQGTQLKAQLWQEIRRLRAKASKSGLNFPHCPLDPSTGIRFDDRILIGIAVDSEVSIAGYSHARILTIADEASGIADSVFDAIHGNSSGGSNGDPNAVSRQLLIGNPTHVTGKFYNCFHGESHLWSCHHISCFDTPNYIANRVIVPGLSTRDASEDSIALWGEDSVKTAVRVFGEFPSGSLATINSLATVNAACSRWQHIEDDGPLEIGVDVATHGDDKSVIMSRRSKKVHMPVAVAGGREEIVAGTIIAHAWDNHRRGEAPPVIKVDTCGVGASVAALLRSAADDGDILRSLLTYEDPDTGRRVGREDILPHLYEGFTLEVHWVNAANSSKVESFKNLRSELWFAGRQFLRDGGSIPPCEMTKADLLAPEYSEATGGKTVVEKKEITKRRLKRSPDYGDAFNLCVFKVSSEEDIGDEEPIGMGFRFSGGSRGY